MELYLKFGAGYPVKEWETESAEMNDGWWLTLRRKLMVRLFCFLSI